VLPAGVEHPLLCMHTLLICVTLLSLLSPAPKLHRVPRLSQEIPYILSMGLPPCRLAGVGEFRRRDPADGKVGGPSFQWMSRQYRRKAGGLEHHDCMSDQERATRELVADLRHGRR